MDVLDVIGDFGRFQKEAFLLISARSLILVFSFYLIHMSVSNVDHWCAPVDPLKNLTTVEWKNCCIPKIDDKYSRCERYQVDEFGEVMNDTTVACDKWEYDRTTIKSSLKTEFNLVCDRKWLLSVMYATFFSGNLVAYPVAGYFCDRFGRRTAVLLGLLGMAIFNTAMIFSNSIGLFITFRVLESCFYTFVQSSTITLFLEIAGRRQRALMPLFTGGVWGLANCIALSVSAVVRNWRYFALIGSSPLIVPYLLLCWKFLPDSPRWLVATKRYEKAKELLNRASKKNGIVIHNMDSVMEALKQKIHSTDGNPKAGSYRELFQDKRLSAILVLILFSFFVNRFLANGFYITLRNLSDNFHVTFAISSTLNVVASILNAYVQAYITRRRLMLLITLGISGLAFLITTGIGQDLKWIRVSIAMLAKFSNKFTSAALTLYVTEVVPTKMRARGNAICQTVGRVGAVVSSFTDLLNEMYGPNSSYFLFGVIALVASFGYILVPDMDNSVLPDSVAETKKNVAKKSSLKKEENLEVAYSALPVS